MTPVGSTRKGNSAQTIGTAATDSEFAERIEELHLDAVELCACEASFKSRSATKSIVLDLAYEEYCLRTEAGLPISARAFAAGFPGYESSLCRLLEVHEAFAADPNLLPDPISWPQVGETFLGFRLVEQLGQGSFARVFLAEELELSNRRVVAKITSAGSGEAELLANLKHEHIVPVNSIKTDQERRLSLICMPFVGRATLCDVLDQRLADGFPRNQREMTRLINEVACDQSRQTVQGRRSPSAAYVNWVIKTGIEITSALVHTHAQNICHSDLKPSNILVAENGSAMLLDFNLSFQGQGQRVGGTVYYMAPEQLRAVADREGSDLHAIGLKADIFSVGVVLYELLTGELPYGASSPGKSMVSLCRDALTNRTNVPQTPRARMPGVDRQLANVIESCLSFDPDQRPSSGDLFEHLRSCSKQSARLRRWAKCHRLQSASIATVVAIAILAGGIIWSQIPSRSLRALNQAKASYRAGDYPETVRACNTVLSDDPRSAAALFLRGRANEAREEFSLAITDFDDCQALLGDARLSACKGSCYQRKQLFDAAIFEYEKARTRGYAPAEVYSNLAFCYLQSAKFPEAIRCCDEAIKLKPMLQQPYEFRAAARINRRNQLEPVPAGAAEDILRAVELEPQSAEIYLAAAQICAAVASSDERWLAKAKELTFAALERGEKPKHITNRLCQSFLESDRERIQNLKLISAPDAAPRVLPVLPPSLNSLQVSQSD